MKQTLPTEPTFAAYLQSRDMAPNSIKHYVNTVALFARRVKKDETHITKADILKHLEYLKNTKGQQNSTRQNTLIALNHYFNFRYQQERVPENPCRLIRIRGTKKRSLYRIYSPAELKQLYDNYHHFFVRCYDDSHIPENQRTRSFLSKERNAALLSLLVHQGITTREADSLLLKDIDLMQATVRIPGSRKSNGRILSLKGTQVGMLMHYTQTIRPQIVDFFAAGSHPEKLFLPLPEYSKQHTDKVSLVHVFKPLTHQVKTIEPSFLNFKQVRASVITHWLKTAGLRKTQYLAGHRYISSTEKYRANDLEELTGDIVNLHPF